jgi:hypothetical protein
VERGCVHEPHTEPVTPRPGSITRANNTHTKVILVMIWLGRTEEEGLQGGREEGLCNPHQPFDFSILNL